MPAISTAITLSNGGRWLAFVVPAHGRAAAVGRLLHHQRQPAVDPRLNRRRSGRTAACRLGLCRQLRRVPDHRRSARRSLWPPPRLFLIGMAGFVATNALCGLANTPSQLIIGRILQGVSAAMLAPQVPGLDPRAVPHRRGTRPGAELLRRDDGACRLDRAVVRRRAGRMEPVRAGLANRISHQAADRRAGDAGRLADGAGDQCQPPPAARHWRRCAGVAGAGLLAAAAVGGPPAGLARLDVGDARRGAGRRRLRSCGSRDG